jgi:hypothetical protein
VVGREWGLRTVPGGPAVFGAVRGRGRFGVPVGRCCDRVVMLGGCMYVQLLLSSRAAVYISLTTLLHDSL